MITIRPATTEDASAITRVYMESADHHARLDAERYAIPSTNFILERYRTGQQHIEDAVATTFVAESAGEIIGFVDVRLDKSPDPMHKDLLFCHIVEIAVSEATRSQGIGAKLMLAAEDWGKSQGAEFASLEYNAANKRASDFYHQRMGYKIASLMAIKRL
jgi:ribosomal protein S18 acetylase RimI-like enzyme